jgi:hypothetical protein
MRSKNRKYVSVMDALAAFFRVVDAYCSGRGVSEARASTLIFNSGDKIAGLRAGRDIGVRRLDRAFRFLADNWPEGAAWPADVPRPLHPAGPPAADAADGVPSASSSPAVASGLEASSLARRGNDSTPTGEAGRHDAGGTGPEPAGFAGSGPAHSSGKRAGRRP